MSKPAGKETGQAAGPWSGWCAGCWAAGSGAGSGVWGRAAGLEGRRGLGRRLGRHPGRIVVAKHPRVGGRHGHEQRQAHGAAPGVHQRAALAQILEIGQQVEGCGVVDGEAVDVEPREGHAKPLQRTGPPAPATAAVPAAASIRRAAPAPPRQARPPASRGSRPRTQTQPSARQGQAPRTARQGAAGGRWSSGALGCCRPGQTR